MNFNPFPTLSTERLLLRRTTKEDAADVFAFRSDPEVMRYIPRPLAQSLEDIYVLLADLDERCAQKERITWGIAHKDTGTIMGMIGYLNIRPQHNRAEIGYALAKAYHRKGYMREALLAALHYGFEQMQLHTIEASIYSENEASAQLLQQVGFQQEAYFRENYYDTDRFIDSVHFGLFAADLISNTNTKR